MSTANDAASAAAEWWAQQVGAPRFDNGDRSLAGDVAGVLATMLSARNPVPDGAGSKFAEALAPRLAAMIERGYGASVGVDYGPDRELAEAAREAGISTNRFPWKTMMWLRADHVTVSAGYRAPTVLVWASEEWLANRPACASQQYDEAKYAKQRDYHGEPFVCSLPIYHDGQHQYDQPIELCAVCAAPDNWMHDSDQRGHMPDFHTFVSAVSA